MTDLNSHQVFISYATPDRERVLPYYNYLKGKGHEVWMDFQSIRPGQNWDFEIKRALDKSTFVVAFISAHSYKRRGYVQRELKIALDNLSEKLVDDIYIVPVLLDDNVEIPDQLKGIQCISDSDSQCKEKVSDSLTFQLGRLGVQTEQAQRSQDLYWQSRIVKESWEGLPGYEFEAQVLTFSSETYPNIQELGDYLKADMLDSLFQHRLGKLTQFPDIYHYGQDKFLRTNTRDAHCGDPKIKGRIMTVQYAIHWYGAGAAHANFHFETFAFVLNPLARIQSLEEIFIDSPQALKLIQESVREQVLKESIGYREIELKDFDRSWIDRGTENWSDFSAFVFSEKNIDLLFAPYHLGSYAEGAKFAEIPYEIIVHIIRPEFRSLLEIEHIFHKANRL